MKKSFDELDKILENYRFSENAKIKIYEVVIKFFNGEIEYCKFIKLISEIYEQNLKINKITEK
jgi:hypothetical protein